MLNDDVVAELAHIRNELAKGSDALFAAEKKLAEASLLFDTTEAKAFLTAEGTAQERKSTATLAASETKFAMDLAKAELNRVRVKLKNLELEQMSLQTHARILERLG